MGGVQNITKNSKRVIEMPLDVAVSKLNLFKFRMFGLHTGQYPGESERNLLYGEHNCWVNKGNIK